jgi:hypothetical protein
LLVNLDLKCDMTCNWSYKLSLIAFTIQLEWIKDCVFQIYGIPHSSKIFCTNINHMNYNSYIHHCMVRATATVVWYRFRFSRKNNNLTYYWHILTFAKEIRTTEYRMYFAYEFPCKTIRNLIFIIVKYPRN